MAQSHEEIEACLAVGIPVLFYQGAQRKGAIHYRTAFRGWRKGAHIIVDRPAADTGAQATLREGMDCTLCFVREGSAWAMTTQVMSWDMSGAIQYARLRWPAAIESTQFRQGERVSVQVPCKLKNESGPVVMGTIEDLSLGGCGALVNTAVEKNARLALSCTLPDGTLVKDVWTIVRNCRARHQQHFLGLSFEEGQVAAVNDIAFFVTSQIERLRTGPAAARPRVLVIDTNEEQAGKIIRNLKRREISGFLAHNVVEGFYRLRSVPPSMVLIHQDNNDLPGADTTRLIRMAERNLHVHIVVYGGDESTARDAAKEAGADEYFPASPTLAPDLGAQVARRIQPDIPEA
jgi:ActR/RegA family two-component response regulator/c-di-GMP-binding flagellar brake protein YcgR